MDLRDILTKVSDARARGISENKINKYLKRKGYTRKRFEDAVLYSIEQDYNNNEYERVAGQKDNPQFWRGVARELTNGMLYEWGDELEAIFRSLVGQETYEEALSKIEDERARFQSIDPTATSLMNLGGSLAGSAMEGGAASKLGLTLPKSLQPVTGQTLRNIPKGATAAAGGDTLPRTQPRIWQGMGQTLTPPFHVPPISLSFSSDFRCKKKNYKNGRANKICKKGWMSLY